MINREEIQRMLSLWNGRNPGGAIEYYPHVKQLEDIIFDFLNTSDNSDYTKYRTAIERICDEMTDPDRIPDDVAQNVFEIAYTALNGKYDKEN